MTKAEGFTSKMTFPWKDTSKRFWEIELKDNFAVKIIEIHVYKRSLTSSLGKCALQKLSGVSKYFVHKNVLILFSMNCLKDPPITDSF